MALLTPQPRDKSDVEVYRQYSNANSLINYYLIDVVRKVNICQALEETGKASFRHIHLCGDIGKGDKS